MTYTTLKKVTNIHVVPVNILFPEQPPYLCSNSKIDFKYYCRIDIHNQYFFYFSRGGVHQIIHRFQINNFNMKFYEPPGDHWRF